MSTLLLRLEGPLQAWSSQGKLSVRDTEREPTKSGVLGLVGAAIGMDRDDDATLALLAQLRMAARVDRAGTLLHDYHTAGGGTFRGDNNYLVHDAKDCIPSHRYYLQDASFTVGLEGDRALLDRVALGFAAPKWPLFLGRRSCPLSVLPVLGVVEDSLDKAIERASRAERHDGHALRAVVECVKGQDGDTRMDVPLSFREGARRYGPRRVRTVWIEFAPERQPQELHT
ncbi:MAG: type I-E CRISPR-associated protein Cas5/CasD [Polyangiales bacterium]